MVKSLKNSVATFAAPIAPIAPIAAPVAPIAAPVAPIAAPVAPKGKGKKIIPVADGAVSTSHNSAPSETVAPKAPNVASYTEKQINHMGKLLIGFEHSDDKTESTRRDDMSKALRLALPQYVASETLAAQMTSEGRKAIPADAADFIGRAVKMLNTALLMEGAPTTRVNGYRRTLQDSFFAIVSPDQKLSLTRLEYLEAKRKADAETALAIEAKLKLEAEKAKAIADAAQAKADAAKVPSEVPVTKIDTVTPKADLVANAPKGKETPQTATTNDAPELAQARSAALTMASTLAHVFAILKKRDPSLVTFVLAGLIAPEKIVVQNVLEHAKKAA